MSNVGFNTWYEKDCTTIFKVKNISKNNKTIKIFQYPILNGKSRDLMEIPYVSEADIRHSLLKGELKNKLVTEEAIIEFSNIDLLQFDSCQKSFLQRYGVTEGLEVEGSGVNFLFRQGIDLIGNVDGYNNTFTTPEKFINGSFGNNIFKILARHNGRVMVEGSDYFVSEGEGSGTGFDTLVLTFVPNKHSVLIADYIVEV